jgi:hypothetical protein
MPLYVHTTLTTGTLIWGKMSVGIRKAAPVPMSSTSTSAAAMVYGRLSKNATGDILGGSAKQRSRILDIYARQNPYFPF